MKKTLKRIVITASLVMLIASFAGCSLLADILGLPLTIDERLAAFSTSLNADSRSTIDILANFAPESEMTNREQAGDLTFWNDLFNPEHAFAFLVTEKSDTTAVLVTMTATYNGELVDTSFLTFKMYEEDSGNWLIEEIWEGGNDLIKGF